MENKSPCVSPEACAPTGVGWSTTIQPSCVSPEGCAPFDVVLSTTSQPAEISASGMSLGIRPLWFGKPNQRKKLEAILIVE